MDEAQGYQGGRRTVVNLLITPAVAFIQIMGKHYAASHFVAESCSMM